MNQPTTPNTVEDFLPVFVYCKEVHTGWPEFNKNNEFSDGSEGTPLVRLADAQAAILADRAQRSPTVAGSVDSPEFRSLMRRYYDTASPDDATSPSELALKMVITHLNARLATAAPSSTPEVDKLDRISERRAEKLSAPSEIEAARLREIARLIGAIFVYGGFKAETHNERQLENLLRDQGVFFDTVAQYEAQTKQEELK